MTGGWCNKVEEGGFFDAGWRWRNLSGVVYVEYLGDGLKHKRVVSSFLNLKSLGESRMYTHISRCHEKCHLELFLQKSPKTSKKNPKPPIWAFWSPIFPLKQEFLTFEKLLISEMQKRKKK